MDFNFDKRLDEELGLMEQLDNALSPAGMVVDNAELAELLKAAIETGHDPDGEIAAILRPAFESGFKIE